MRRKRLPKKYLQTLFRLILLGVEDLGDGLVKLKNCTIGEENEIFRRKVVARWELREYLEMVRVPEGKAEELAVVLFQEKIEKGEGL